MVRDYVIPPLPQVLVYLGLINYTTSVVPNTMAASTKLTVQRKSQIPNGLRIKLLQVWHNSQNKSSSFLRIAHPSFKPRHLPRKLHQSHIHYNFDQKTIMAI